MRNVNLTRLFALLLISFSLILVASCSKDDDASVTIVGTWTISDGSVGMTIDGVSYVNYLINLGMTPAQAQSDWEDMQNDMIAPIGGTIEFKSNGSLVASWDIGTSPTWSMGNNKLTINSDGEIMIFDVIILTSTECTISLIQTEVADFSQDGQAETMVMTMQLVFTR